MQPSRRRAPIAFRSGPFHRQVMPRPGRSSVMEATAAPATGAGIAPRTIAISATGASGEIRFQLSAGDAAELMFQIGYALEQAAVFDRDRMLLG